MAHVERTIDGKASAMVSRVGKIRRVKNIPAASKLQLYEALVVLYQ